MLPHLLPPVLLPWVFGQQSLLLHALCIIKPHLIVILIECLLGIELSLICCVSLVALNHNVHVVPIQIVSLPSDDTLHAALILSWPDLLVHFLVGLVRRTNQALFSFLRWFPPGCSVGRSRSWPLSFRRCVSAYSATLRELIFTLKPFLSYLGRPAVVLPWWGSYSAGSVASLNRLYALLRSTRSSA